MKKTYVIEWKEHLPGNKTESFTGSSDEMGFKEALEGFMNLVYHYQTTPNLPDKYGKPDYTSRIMLYEIASDKNVRSNHRVIISYKLDNKNIKGAH